MTEKEDAEPMSGYLRSSAFRHPEEFVCIPLPNSGVVRAQTFLIYIMRIIIPIYQECHENQRRQ